MGLSRFTKHRRKLRNQRLDKYGSKRPFKKIRFDPKDEGLINKHLRRKKRRNPTNNISLSGKRRRKVLNSLKRGVKQQMQMEGVETTTAGPSKNKKKKKVNTPADVEMKSVDNI